MRQLRLLLPEALASRIATLIFCGFVLLAATSMAQAQSGRRVPKPLPPEPAPPPTSETAVKKPEAKPETPRLSLIVSIDERSSFTYIPLYFYRAAMDGCLSRLKEASNVKVTAEKEMTRGEAVKRAKSQTESYVVWLQLDNDAFDRVRAEDLFVRYTVFAPGTAAVKADGRAYQGYRRGRGTIGSPVPRSGGGLYTEYLLKEAGRDAAERVMQELGVHLPSDRSPVPTFPFDDDK